MLVVNGHYISLDFFKLLGILRVQTNMIEEINGIGMQQETAIKLLTEINRNIFTYKVPGSYVKTNQESGRIYINNLEKDSKYSKWSKDYEQFLMTYGFQLEKIARNFFNLILISNVRSESSWNDINITLDLYKKNWPIRIGFIFTGDDKYSHIISQGINQIKHNKVGFLQDLSHFTSVDKATEIFYKYCKNCSLNNDNFSNHFCEDYKICAKYNWILNGRILNIKIIDSDIKAFKQNLLLELNKEKREILKHPIYSNELYPIDDYFENLRHEKPDENINLNIDTLSEEEHEFIMNIGYIFKVSNYPLVTYTLIVDENDKEITTRFIYFLKNNQSVSAQIRLVLNFKHISHYWNKILCFISYLNKNEIKAEFENFICDLSKEDIKSEFIIISKENFKWKLLINGRIIKNPQINSNEDILNTYNDEISRFGLNSIKSDSISSISLENIFLIYFRNLKRIPYIASYSQYTRSYNLTKIIHKTDSYFNIELLLNPLSEKGKIASALVKWLLYLNSSLDATINISQKVWNLNSYYQYHIKYSFDQSLIFDEINHHTYGLSIITPENWKITSESATDIDNLLVKQNITVGFKLENLLVIGTSSVIFNETETEPKTGLQLTLSNNTYKMSTFVMKSFGYFQFYADPGVYSLLLGSKNSKLFYSILNSQDITIKDLTFANLHIRYSKNIESKIENLYKQALKDDIIHVYMISSGSFYERTLKITILSIMKNTRSTIKFWFYEDFFSSKFKSSIKNLSKRIGFLYEFLSYKWPNWLPHQNEKQRIIWAYKVFFIDIMFLDNVSKIIHVDADQVWRSDIKELWDIDLKGAAYGFVPFCDDNPETVDLHIWKTPYWTRYLKGKTYHIGALYILDLNKFRNSGAGEKIRYAYDYFANKQPFHLPNIDQDLINLLQFQIPIYSLPNDWLWCGSWCSEKHKGEAKVIDLCNNPATKEPKILAAKRIIEEWNEYDQIMGNLESNKNIKIDL